MDNEVLMRIGRAAIAYRSAQNHLWNTIIQHVGGMCSVKERHAAEEKLEAARAEIDAAIEVFRAQK
jgi:hypothetical protein